jgi:ribosome biogenesis GTPase
MNATVYKSTGSWYQVKDEEGRQWNARIRGVLKIDDITSTNPIAVGDKVEMDLENDLENSIITGILPAGIMEQAIPSA